MRIDVNGITLFYEAAGKGRPLILLHGNGEDHHIFDALVEKLKAEFTVYAIDSRNHGQSSKTKDFSYETMADDVHAFMGALSLSPGNIIGFSDGAIIALLVAMNHPEDIERIALLGVNLKPEDFTAESLEYVKAEYAETGDPLLKLMLEEPQIDIESLKDVQIPTLLIAAEHEIFKPELYEHMLETLPNAKLMIMEGHEHDSYITGQDMLYPDLLAFFSS